MVKEITPTKPRWNGSVLYIFFFGLSMFLCVPPGPTQYIFHTPMTRYSLFVLKVLLNTNQPTSRGINEENYLLLST